MRKTTKEKELFMTNKNLPDVVVTVEKSGNRFNAWDSDGNKRTSEITTGARKKAFELRSYTENEIDNLYKESKNDLGDKDD